MGAGVNEKTSDESGVAKWAIVHADGNRRQRKGGRGLCSIAKWAIVPPMVADVNEKASEESGVVN